MVYVIGVASFKNPDQRLIKIGFSDNWENRKNRYISANPLTKFLFTVDGGTEQDEKNLHSYFKELKYQGYGKEWFNYDESIIEFFRTNDTIEKIRQIVGEPVERITDVPLFVAQVVQVLALFNNWKVRAKEIDLEEQELARLGTFDAKEILESIKSRYPADFLTIERLITTWLDIYNKIKSYSVSEIADSDKTKCDKVIEKFYQDLSASNHFHINLEVFCNFLDQFKDNYYITRQLFDKILDVRFWLYYTYLGTIKCKARLFRDNILIYVLIDSLQEKEVREEVIKAFDIGIRYSLKDIKIQLRKIYASFGLIKKPKATDLNQWFEVKAVAIFDEFKNKTNGFEILSLKEEEK